MKKELYVLILFVSLCCFSANVWAQQITITNTNDSPANAVSICQCDTLRFNPGPPASKGTSVTYSFASLFPSNSTFYYEFAVGTNFPAADSLDLVGLRTNPATTPVDTFSAANEKWASLAIPCNAALGPSSLRIRNSNGEISDTIYYIVNRIPSEPIIDSIAFGFENPYTTVDDWGFCRGDSVVLYVENQLGASYQWLRGGFDLLGETNDSLVVKNSGAYSVRVDLGACDLTSKDTIINDFLPLTDITATPTAFIDIDTVPPIDSAHLCETASLTLRGPNDPTGVLTYTYQWLTDSITQFNDVVIYPLVGETNQTLSGLDSNARYYLVVNDGFCVDTSNVFTVLVDTIPTTSIASIPFFGPGPITFNDVCMKVSDSVLLAVQDNFPPDLWKYQWQRYNTSTGTWINLPNDTNARLTVDTARQKVQTPTVPLLSYYRVVVNKIIRTGFPPFVRTTCSFTTDSIRIRWFPEYDLNYGAQPFINQVGQDSVNFCETDSVTIIAPPTPNTLVNNGLFYSYQWLTDSVNSMGQRVPYALAGETNASLRVDSGLRYYVVINDGICVDTSDAFWVFVDSIPSTTIINDPSTDLDLCYEDSVIIAAQDSVLPGWDYQWQRLLSTGWTNLPADTLPWITIDTSYFPIQDTAHYRLMIDYENRFGLRTCSYITDSISINFYAPPNINFIPGDSLGLCPGDSILIVATGNSLSYQWNGGSTLGASIYASSPGQYFVEGTGINGCINYDTVNVFPYATSAGISGPTSLLTGQKGTFVGSGGRDYQWLADEPLNWSSFIGQTVQLSYNLPDSVDTDTINIFMIAINAEGCTDTATVEVVITRTPQQPDFEILSNSPNLFTPNGDGYNDVWDMSRVTNGDACKITIINRWGSPVYTDESFDGLWDGSDQGGNPLPDGTYYYILECIGEIRIKNAVTIMRNNQ